MNVLTEEMSNLEQRLAKESFTSTSQFDSCRDLWQARTSNSSNTRIVSTSLLDAANLEIVLNRIASLKIRISNVVSLLKRESSYTTIRFKQNLRDLTSLAIEFNIILTFEKIKINFSMSFDDLSQDVRLWIMKRIDYMNLKRIANTVIRAFTTILYLSYTIKKLTQ